MSSVPLSLPPFFQEYVTAKLTHEKNARTIIERVSQFGNRAEIRWLLWAYSQNEISNWVKRWSKNKLLESHGTFWRIVLDISE